MPGHKVGPVWRGRGDTPVNHSNMKTISAQRVTDLTGDLRRVKERVVELRTSLEAEEERERKMQESLDYWKTAHAIATEIDKRLDEGEEVTVERKAE